MNNRENLLGVIRTLFKWKKSIILTTIIAALGSAVLSVLFLDNYFQSNTIFYAASPDMSKPQHIFGETSSEMDYYGDDTDVDHILAIAHSNELMGYLIKEFDLYKVYEIDSTQKKAQIKVRKALMGNYEVMKNKYEAIELSIEDKSPELSARMTNAAREKINGISQRLIKKNQYQLIKTYEKNIADKRSELQILGDSLVKMRKRYGIYNIETQSELIASLVAKAETTLARKEAKAQALRGSAPRDSMLYLNAEIQGLKNELTSLTSSESKSAFNLKRFNEGMAYVEVLAEMHEKAREALSEDTEKFTQLSSAMNSVGSGIILVEEASIPIEKSRPKRSLIVLACTFLGFLFSTVAALLLENYSDVNWREVIHGE